jgi:hypothetical protein
MSQPQVEGDAGIAGTEADTGVKRTGLNSSQPAKLSRPLEESARLANEKTENTLLGVTYDVSPEDGYRKQ